MFYNDFYQSFFFFFMKTNITCSYRYNKVADKVADEIVDNQMIGYLYDSIFNSDDENYSIIFIFEMIFMHVAI